SMIAEVFGIEMAEAAAPASGGKAVPANKRTAAHKKRALQSRTITPTRSPARSSQKRATQKR
ncbi:MAG: hypothetical protein ACT4PS_15365, partial [Betaproteobacteria bacterium]